MDDLTAWLRSAGVTVIGEHPLRTDDGEVRLTVLDDGGTWVVAEQWRDTDRGAQLRAGSWADVERYLVGTYLADARRAHGLSRLRPLALPGRDGVPAPAEGCRMSGDDAHGWEVVMPDGRTLWFASPIRAAAFTRYAAFTPTDLRAQASEPASPLAR